MKIYRVEISGLFTVTVEETPPDAGFQTMAEMFRSMIMAGGKTPEEIHQAVEEAFNKKVKKDAYRYYRNQLISRGETVPDMVHAA